jgi:hypothetical protein
MNYIEKNKGTSKSMRPGSSVPVARINKHKKVILGRPARALLVSRAAGQAALFGSELWKGRRHELGGR